MSQTIVALATPFGRSGIGVIRLSGPDCLEIVGSLTSDTNFSLPPRQAVLKELFDPESKELIDHALITYFKSPQSFTGEDVVEISCHGSPILLRQIIDFCLKAGARLAEPGEFSLRALANGQMNLSQAEAIRDLIDAQTIASARIAIRQLRGELSNHLQILKDDLLNIIVVLESSIEFVEDDLPDFQTETIKAKIVEIAGELEKLASTFSSGRLLREGLKVALVGRPNVGKSSLFNSLLGANRAIVTDIAGTTRDSIFESLNIKGIPVSLIDTAGLRETSEVVERIGVDRSKQIIADSDLAILVLDNSQGIIKEDQQIFDEVKGLNYLVVINKLDLTQGEYSFDEFLNGSNFVKVSAKTGEGLLELQNSIVEKFIPDSFQNAGFLISDARHFDLLNRAIIELYTSHELISSQSSEEIILIGLHNALKFLGEITGETTTDDILTRIFSTFCIGK